MFRRKNCAHSRTRKYFTKDAAKDTILSLDTRKCRANGTKSIFYNFQYLQISKSHINISTNSYTYVHVKVPNVLEKNDNYC